MKTATEILQENVDFYLELEEVAKIVKAMKEYAKQSNKQESTNSDLGAVSNRFFFFVYSYWCENREGKGNLSIKSKGFPKQKYVTAKAIEQVSNKYDEPMLKISAVIESWIEMSEEDYAEWLS